MTPIMVSALAIVLGETLAVEAGADLAAAAARARPGDTLRLSAGVHRGSLGRLSGVAVSGAGAGVTVVLVPEGADGVVATGPLTLSGLSLVAGPRRAALKVLGGAVALDGVALEGGSCGAFLDEGTLDGRDVWLAGDYGLLQRRGAVTLVDVQARGRLAGLALIGAGELTVRRAAITGPSQEAGLTVAGGKAHLDQVFVRSPGPSGLAIAGGEVDGRDVSVAGASGVEGFLGDCVLVRNGALRLSASELVACSGASVETARATVHLDGVDAAGGEVGCLVFTERTRADLRATLCTRGGPGLVAMGGSTVTGFGARFWTDPVMAVECPTGARVTLEGAPTLQRPCASAP